MGAEYKSATQTWEWKAGEQTNVPTTALVTLGTLHASVKKSD